MKLKAADRRYLHDCIDINSWLCNIENAQYANLSFLSHNVLGNTRTTMNFIIYINALFCFVMLHVILFIWIVFVISSDVCNYCYYQSIKHLKLKSKSSLCTKLFYFVVWTMTSTDGIICIPVLSSKGLYPGKGQIKMLCCCFLFQIKTYMSHFLLQDTFACLQFNTNKCAFSPRGKNREWTKTTCMLFWLIS